MLSIAQSLLAMPFAQQRQEQELLGFLEVNGEAQDMNLLKKTSMEEENNC